MIGEGKRTVLDRTPVRRVIIEGVTPQVDEGRFPVKRTPGEDVVVEADAFADGHDVLAAVVLWRRCGDEAWNETPLIPLGNDRSDHVGIARRGAESGSINLTEARVRRILRAALRADLERTDH